MSTPMEFPATADPLYLLNDEVGTLALTDQLSARQAQLHAVTFGSSGDAFRRLSPTYQENYLWACAMIAEEVRELFAALRARLGDQLGQRLEFFAVEVGHGPELHASVAPADELVALMAGHGRGGRPRSRGGRRSAGSRRRQGP